MIRCTLLFLICLVHLCFSRGAVDQLCSSSEEQTEEHEHEEVTLARSELLQKTAVRAVRHPLQPTDYALSAFPLAWTHVPKCGSALVNSLIRLPGVCNLPEIKQSDTVFDIGQGSDTNFFEIYPEWDEVCPGIQRLPETRPCPDCPVKASFHPGMHYTVGPHFEDLYNGHGIIMLRQPEQRLISMYNMMIQGEDDYEMPDHLRLNQNITSWAPSGAGCAVRMLTKEQPLDSTTWSLIQFCSGNEVVAGAYPAVRREFVEVSSSDADEARERLRGYAFVGITDQWDLSICLLHAMFGGMCYAAEFAAVGLQRSNKTTDYDTDILEGFVDPYDGPLYEEALAIFNENLVRYHVSDETCQPCYSRASKGVEGHAYYESA